MKDTWTKPKGDTGSRVGSRDGQGWGEGRGGRGGMETTVLEQQLINSFKFF